jgi:acetyltransferase-like isoleucine patch superfamily enzyme
MPLNYLHRKMRRNITKSSPDNAMILRRLYLSPLGLFLSLIMRMISVFHKPFMVYGYFDKPSGKFRKNTRVSSNAKLLNRATIRLDDNIWIGHFCLIDGTGGVKIGEGVNISSHTAIYSHSSNDALRLLSKDYIRIEAKSRPGYILKAVEIGEYTFIGSSSVILPGVTIGRGCIIGAGSLINISIPDYSIAYGNPIRINGDTRERDKILYPDLIIKDTYYQNLKTER